MTIFTICSNNYLGQAIVLGHSISNTQPGANFLIVLMDEVHPSVKYSEIPFEVLPAKNIESSILDLAKKYDIIELNTAIKPRVFEFLFLERRVERAVYLDPDIRAFSKFTEIENGLLENNILITPHIFSPIPHDGKSPQESLFLNYGIYNLGFIAVKRSEESLKFILWWKGWTYNFGYNEVANGVFVDQLPINYVPLFYKGVSILRSKGYNMAPWNIHERYLSRVNGEIFVNGKDRLAFYHFSSFKLDSGDLPVHNYTRFSMKERFDLIEIHDIYNNELKAASYLEFRKIPCIYVAERKNYLLKHRDEVLNAKSFFKRYILSLFRTQLFRKLGSMIAINNKSFDGYYERRF